MRLDRFITSVTDYSRSDTKKLAKQGAIRVNEQVVNKTSLHIHTDSDTVYLFDEALTAPCARYFMLHKPLDTVCATIDSEHPTVIDLIDEPNATQLQIAGRLDKDTTGLVLLTDDGQWNHCVTAPSRQCFKTYQVTADQVITPEMIKNLENGVLLRGESSPTLPAKVQIINPKVIELSIQEGRYHQVKRMLASVGNRVVKLHRLAIGHISLDSDLACGHYRPLTSNEVQGFLNPEQQKNNTND